MPKKIDEFWRRRVFTLVSEHPSWSVTQLAEAIVAEAAQYDRDDWPSDRTIRRLRDEFRQLSETQRARYRTFEWPLTMEQRDLPWEAAAVGLELLQLFRQSGAGRPPVRLVRWTWRVLQAAPMLPFLHAVMLAGLLSAKELLHDILPFRILDAIHGATEEYLVNARQPADEKKGSGAAWLRLWSSLLDLTLIKGTLNQEMAQSFWVTYFEEVLPIYRLVDGYLKRHHDLTVIRVTSEAKKLGLVPEEVAHIMMEAVVDAEQGIKGGTR